MTVITEKPSRGKILGVYLIFLILLNVVLIIVTGAFLIGYIRDHDPQFTGTRQWLIPMQLLVEMVTTGALIALWFWRKVGFRVLIVTAILDSVLMFLLNSQFLNAVQPIATLLILWGVIEKRWQYFH